jgi:hypothetical protein
MVTSLVEKKLPAVSDEDAESGLANRELWARTQQNKTAERVDPTYSPDFEHFVRDMAERIHDEEDWLAFLEFGMGTLLESPSLLLDLVVARAELGRVGRGANIGDAMLYLFDQLGVALTFAVPQEAPE